MEGDGAGEEAAAEIDDSFTSLLESSENELNERNMIPTKEKDPRRKEIRFTACSSQLND
jgi:hypothetical protein